GEYADFYDYAFNRAFDIGPDDVSEVHTSEEADAELEPELWSQFAEEYDFDPGLEFPSIEGPTTAFLNDQNVTTVEFEGSSPSGAELLLEVRAIPESLRAEVTGRSVRFIADGQVTTPLIVELRMFDGRLGSDPLFIAIQPSARPPEPGPVGSADLSTGSADIGPLFGGG
ncbi:MAG: hypothetical protein QME72_19820, partial [Rhodococcus sp. (in: high G+C Gram-positive bacteria)]